jgi:hypothetical protein
VTRFGVKARSLSSGAWLWVRPSGTPTAHSWAAAGFRNRFHAEELARRLPRWQECMISEIPAVGNPTPKKVAPTPEAEAAESAVGNPTPTDWSSAGEVGLQERRLASGEVKYRKRAAGKVSPSFTSLEDAKAWTP